MKGWKQTSLTLITVAVGLVIAALADELQTYVPEFPKTRWPVTLRQLMGHTAGVRTDSRDEGPLFSVHCERPVEAVPHAPPILFYCVQSILIDRMTIASAAPLPVV